MTLSDADRAAIADEFADIRERDAAFGPVVGDIEDEDDPEGWYSVVVAEGHKDGDQPATDRRRLLAALSDAEAELAELLTAIETEWYNGNMDEPARDRLFALHRERRPAEEGG